MAEVVGVVAELWRYPVKSMQGERGSRVKVTPESPPWNGKLVWIHGDLLKFNLLVQGGRLSAVIDFGGVGTCDNLPLEKEE